MKRVVLVIAILSLAACSRPDDSAAATGISLDVAVPSSTTALTSTTTTTTGTTTVPATTTSTTTPTTTTTTTTTATPTTTTSTSTTTTTVPTATTATITPIDAFAIPVDVETEIGRSVEDRPITVIRRGTPGGVRVLVVGVIHGNEADGVAIVDRLAVEPAPDDVELWLVRSMNPDGQARHDRQNAHAVDLNRNFPENWDLLGEPGVWEYGGPGPASEPETQAMVALGDSVQPNVILWYHQDLFRIAPGSGRSGEIRTRYAEIAGLPIVSITGGTYTGTASQWSRTVIPQDGVGITVELGPTVSEADIVAHVNAVHTIALEYF